jgi:glycosyltransferase involved in cell wall biosynthesis
MRVLYLVDSLGVGGAEQSLLEIASRLRQAQPTVCSVWQEDTLRPRFAAAGIPVVSLDIRRERELAQGWFRLLRMLRQEAPDLLHLTGLYAGLLGRCAGRWLRIPVIDSFTNESYTAGAYASLPRKARLKLAGFQLLEQLTMRCVDQVIANSATVAQSNGRSLHVPAGKIEVIYRGRSPERWTQVSDAAKTAMCTALALPAEARVIVNVARLIPRKGQADLIAAMPKVLATVPAARLLVAGEGHNRARLARRIESCGLEDAVRLLGTVRDVPALLALAELFVFPSHYEGLPGALIEAMLAGCPVVAADTPVHREMVEPGVTGLLATVGDPQAWAESILWMLGHPSAARAMGRRGQEIARERYDIDRVVARYEAVYRQVLAAAQGPT